MSDEQPPPSSSLRDPFAPASKPLPPPPPKPPRDLRVVKRAAVIASAALVLAGAGVLAWRLWPRREPPLPFPAAELPPLVRSVTKSIRNYRIKGSEERAWSWYARACGGPDVFLVAERGEQFYAAEELAEIIHDKKETAKSLACGKAIAGKVGRHASYELDVGDAVHATLELAKFADDELPLGNAFKRKDRKGFAAMWCIPDEAGDCSPSAGLARLSRGDAWVFGAAPDVEAFGAALATGQKRDAREASTFETLARRFAAYEVTEIGSAHGHLEFEPFELLDDQSPDVRKSRQAFEAKVSDLGAQWATGGPLEEEGELRLELALSSDGEAKDLFTSLKELRIALKHSEPNKYDEADRSVRKYRIAYEAMERRALTDADPVLDGTTVELVMKMQAKKDELEAFRDYRDVKGKKDEGPATLVRDLIDGKLPSDETLRAVGGRDLWKTVEAYERGDAARERTEPPVPVDVPDFPDARAPGGGEPGLVNPGRSYTFHGSADDAVAIVNEAKRLLKDSGWELVLSHFLDGPQFHCFKSGHRMILDMRRRHNELELMFLPW